jgi:hypothetical protein
MLRKHTLRIDSLGNMSLKTESTEETQPSKTTFIHFGKHDIVCISQTTMNDFCLDMARGMFARIYTESYKYACNNYPDNNLSDTFTTLIFKHVQRIGTTNKMMLSEQILKGLSLFMQAEPETYGCKYLTIRLT